MCNSSKKNDDYLCDKFHLKFKLELLVTTHLAIDNYGNEHVPLWKVKEIINLLECDPDADL